MQLACERCNEIINEYLDKYETTTRKIKGYREEFVLCGNCNNELDKFIYNYQKVR